MAIQVRRLRPVADEAVEAVGADIDGVAALDTAGGGYGGDVVVSRGRDFPVGRVVTESAGVVVLPADFRTGHSPARMMLQIVIGAGAGIVAQITGLITVAGKAVLLGNGCTAADKIQGDPLRQGICQTGAAEGNDRFLFLTAPDGIENCGQNSLRRGNIRQGNQGELQQTLLRFFVVDHEVAGLKFLLPGLQNQIIGVKFQPEVAGAQMGLLAQPDSQGDLLRFGVIDGLRHHAGVGLHRVGIELNPYIRAGALTHHRQQIQIVERQGNDLNFGGGVVIFQCPEGDAAQMGIASVGGTGEADIHRAAKTDVHVGEHIFQQLAVRPAHTGEEFRVVHNGKGAGGNLIGAQTIVDGEFLPHGGGDGLCGGNGTVFYGGFLCNTQGAAGTPDLHILEI